MSDDFEQAVNLIESALYDHCDQSMAMFEEALDEMRRRHRAREEQAAIDGEHEEGT